MYLDGFAVYRHGRNDAALVVDSGCRSAPRARCAIGHIWRRKHGPIMPHPVEEGSGAPSFRPLWRLMPYLWPKGRPDLRWRVVWSIVFLMLGIIATTISQQFLGAAVDAFGTTPQTAVLWVVIALVAAYALSRILIAG